MEQRNKLVKICASCKRILGEDDLWYEWIEGMSDLSKERISHGICPDCIQSLYPNVSKYIDEQSVSPPADLLQESLPK